MIAAHAVGRGSRSGDKRSFFSPIEGVKNRGLDKVETFSALVQVCFFSAGAKVPTPSVINGSPLRLEEVPRLAKGRDLKKLQRQLLIAWMLIP